MKKNEATYLFVDGTNLYAGQYELYGPEKYLDFTIVYNSIIEPLSMQEIICKFLRVIHHQTKTYYKKK